MKPVLKNEGFPSVPETTWQDVGGLSEVREELRRKMLDPIKEPDLLANYNKTSSGEL
jgi:ribosome biogenesis ATPase